MSFLQAAGRKTSDLKEFLREATGSNSLKYKAEKGQKHFIYIPFQSIENVGEDGNKTVSRGIMALQGAIHEWNSPDGKYKSVICLKDVVRENENEDGSKTTINDGSCPFCDTVSEAWDVYRYRFEQEALTCGKTGVELDKHLEAIKGDLAKERKSKEARDFIYILIVRFRTDPTKNNAPVMSQNGLPEFDLKVMKLSAQRVENIQKQMENSGCTFEDSEIIFEYPNVDDARLVVSQSTTAPVFPANQFTQKYPGLKEAIMAEVSKFQWDGIEKAFPEWNGMTTAEATKTINDQFNTWRKYQAELLVNPNAKYLEYVGNAQAGNPALAGAVAPSFPGAAPQIPSAAPSVAVGALDANAVFGASTTPVGTVVNQVAPTAPAAPTVAPEATAVNNTVVPPVAPTVTPNAIPGMAPQVAENPVVQPPASGEIKI